MIGLGLNGPETVVDSIRLTASLRVQARVGERVLPPLIGP